MSRFRTTSLVSLLALAVASAPVIHAAQFTDSFANGTANGVDLHMRRMSGGSEIWEATNNLIVVRDGGRGFASVRTVGAFVARIPVPPRARVLTLEGDLRAVSGTDKACWTAIGVGNPALNPITMLWPGGVFVLLNTRGEYECHYSPSGTSPKLQRIKMGRVAGIDPSKPTPFVMRVDTEAHTLTVEVNKQVVVDNYELANLGDYALHPHFAGFSGYGQAPGTDVISRFSLRTEP